MFDLPLQAVLAQTNGGTDPTAASTHAQHGLAIHLRPAEIINFTHGAQFLMAAFIAWIGLDQLARWLDQPGFAIRLLGGAGIAPVLVAMFGMAIERLLLRRLYHLDHLYGLLLTFGMALMLEGGFRYASAPPPRL